MVKDGGTKRRPADLPPPFVFKFHRGERASRWYPMLANTWTLNPPLQNSQVGRSSTQPRNPAPSRDPLSRW